MTKPKRLVLSLLFVFFLFFIDQFSKYLIRQSGGFYLCNQGIAWGIKLPTFIFWIFWILIILVIFYLFYKEFFKTTFPKKYLVYALILIFSGAVGNLTDRIVFGCIIDFIDLKIWPVFNLADSFITIGVILIIILDSRFLIFKK